MFLVRDRTCGLNATLDVPPNTAVRLTSGSTHYAITSSSGGGNESASVPTSSTSSNKIKVDSGQLIEQADEEEAAALAEYRARQAAGTAITVPQAEVRRRFGRAAR